jgi:uncharacterized lipoprotein YmbA
MSCARLARRVPSGPLARSAWRTLSLLLLAGCASSPPMHYYTLSEVPPASPPPLAHGTGTLPPPARLGSMAMPAELDRQELVTHSGANQVQVHEFNRWAAPLDEQIRRTLYNDLAARVTVTAPPLIVDPNAPASREPRRTLAISLSHLDIDAQCAVSLAANWTIEGGGVEGQSGLERVDQPAAAGECPGAAAATLSQALAVLADRLLPYLMNNTPPL